MPKQLKKLARQPARPADRPAAPPPAPAPAATHAPDAAVLRRVAAEAGRAVPPATVRPARRTVLVNIKVSEELADALAQRAEAEGITQKQVITRALAKAGLPVDSLDLQDRSPRRRRAG
jgi:hypothetical protein